MIDLHFFWKIFTSIVASFGIIMTFWNLVKQLKKNTKEAKAEMKKREKREEALNTLADNIEILLQYPKSAEEQELMKFGMLAILRFRVNRLCSVIKEQGFMTIDEKIDLDDLYTAYETLGGNSRTHELYEYTIKNYKIKNN